MGHWPAVVVVLLLSIAVRAEEIDGFGRTIDDARADARQHALERLQGVLDRRTPPLVSWRPSLKDIERLLEGPGRAGTSVHVEPLGLQHQWILTVRLPGDAEIERRDRQFARQQTLGAIALAAVVLCGLGWGLGTWRRR